VAFDPSKLILGDMTIEQATAAYAVAQTAYLAMLTGQQVVTAAYGQGDGMQTVTYRQVNQGALVQHMLMLKAIMNPGHHPRRARMLGF